jgi:protein TonB
VNVPLDILDQEPARHAAAWTLAAAAHLGVFLLVGAALLESAHFAVAPESSGGDLELDAWIEPPPASPAAPPAAPIPVVPQTPPPRETALSLPDEPALSPPPVAVEPPAAHPAPAASLPAPAVDTARVPHPVEGASKPAASQAAIPAPVAPGVPAPAPTVPALQARANYERNPPPPYPRSARRQGLQGVVLLAVRVNERGRVESLHVVESSGHAVLDQAALKAVRDWRFRPARAGPLPIASTVEVPVRFTLADVASPR